MLPKKICFKFSAFLSTTEPTTTATAVEGDPNGNGSEQDEQPDVDADEDVKTIIQSLHITSNIQFRYLDAAYQ